MAPANLPAAVYRVRNAPLRRAVDLATTARLPLRYAILTRYPAAEIVPLPRPGALPADAEVVWRAWHDYLEPPGYTLDS